jgi:hypothetical protein
MLVGSGITKTYFETRDYLGGMLRSGNRTSAYKAKDFLTAMLHKLPGEITVTRLRADSGFFSLDFLHWLARTSSRRASMDSAWTRAF